MNTSTELQNWLDTRENALKFKAKFYEEGGHVMLTPSAYNPKELDEPLRSEALAYFNVQSKGY